MAMRDRVLRILEGHRGESVSGEEIASVLKISRAAVWKAIDLLRADGHDIAAATNRGYMLTEQSDVLCRESVQAHLAHELQLVLPKRVDSTTTLLWKMALENAPHGTVVLADKQEAGKGRYDRRFFSPEGGLYLSILLRLPVTAAQSASLTIAACVGVCRAVERMCGVRCEIKWVNDVFLNDKKICGILTKAAVGMETALLECAVVGVGLNFIAPKGGYPPEIKDIAGSLYPYGGAPITRSRMAAALIDELWDALLHFDDPAIMQEYQSRSMVLGKSILVLRGDTQRRATALSVLPDGRLRVRYDEGGREDLFSGEVRILPQ
ncbi:MAG: biotin--[acetyl-CoA-carboxylase] ligase [Christensenellaceae bacterium]|jgi:BirA family biotin operon repressor/biotin-[acetyl-CoA-carboxylase] ligase|nr:biotin--[acetyl-CoA-carboxylase] ligase [Christensenellaceae bacterium]